MSAARFLRGGLAGRIVAAGLVGLVAACASGPDRPKPGPLEPITAPIAGRVVWQQKLEGVQFPLAVAVNGGVFTVAATDGTVVALQADSGREVWRASVGKRLSAGVGSDGRYAAVVTRDGELVVLDAGRPLWRKPLGVRVDTAPLVAGERVFVLGSERSVRAFDALDGRLLWTVRRTGDPLTLSEGGVVAAFKNTLLVGQGPRLAGLDPDNGAVRWDVAVAQPRGTNEIERLADLVGPIARTGDVVCARAFQSAVGCVNAERGSLSWSRNIGGLQAVGFDGTTVVGADASDRITAWKAGGGEIAWTNEKLAYRSLSAPVLVGSTVVFGDGEGTVHVLSRDNGATQLRLPTDGSPIVAAPVVSGTTVLVVTRKGGLFALRPQ
ncbi:outer membrane protein assembly factor BamB [Piscinibacter sakaiensis]|uniref:Outer membrane protein assembly factor BamB n=1 Tax=Piscinibacter sakaiensis TaxID=1547922 RepID=A0A0K8P720_PISS1|nr:outer membrane protein assembly factor BamB [Piscinibacter sakaiensis]GAP38417.1 outer membrane protein YfgL [Piscinibacter sakaiensis]